MSKMLSKIIKVTKTEIDMGDRNKATSCPVARGFHAAGFHGAEVYDSTFVTLCEPKKEIQLPKRVTLFIRRFDAGEPVKPFSFRFRWRK